MTEKSEEESVAELRELQSTSVAPHGTQFIIDATIQNQYFEERATKKEDETFHGACAIKWRNNLPPARRQTGSGTPLRVKA